MFNSMRAVNYIASIVSSKFIVRVRVRASDSTADLSVKFLRPRVGSCTGESMLSQHALELEVCVPLITRLRTNLRITLSVSLINTTRYEKPCVKLETRDFISHYGGKRR